MDGKNLKILVVDDEEFNQKILIKLLDRYGYRTIEVAGTGKEALSRLHAESFDAVLLDITMPDTDGYEVLKLIQQDDNLREIPVIMITGIEDKESVIRCIELGAADYLQKPIDPVILRARLDACLEKKQLRDRQLDYLNQIRTEKRKVDHLLNTILPSSAARELKESGRVPPRRYENVAVLFCDIVGFTHFCENHTAEEVVHGLQELVEDYEEITRKHGLEKIKTIGDEFMLAANLTIPNETPLLSAASCGLEMIRATRRSPHGWSVRVGIDHGPVVAGIVGHDKYQFDLWGDTVNTASRMTSISRVNCVSLTRAAWEQVNAHCIGRVLGKIKIKGKHSVEVAEIEDLFETHASTTEASGVA